MSREIRLITKKIYEISLDGGYLDSMHQEFVSRLDEIFSSKPQGKKELDLLTYEYLCYLLFYARNHFKEEELFMQSVGYPDMEEHIRFHQEYLAFIKCFEDKLKQKGASKELLEDMEDFALGWSIAHINCQDRKIADHAKGIAPRSSAA